MRLMIAGGGTGGHLFPGVAVAEELRAREPDAEVVFVGTERGIEARVLPDLGWKLELIEVSGLKTVGPLKALLGLFRIPKAMLQARRLIKRCDPDVVLGVGGYASGPVVLMARLMGIPTAILEQNSIPGFANKILGKVVHKVFLAFDETRRFFAAKRIVMSGNPIRRNILQSLQAATAPATETRPPVAAARPLVSPPPQGEGQGGGAAALPPATPDRPPPSPHADPPPSPHLFIFGGSQGAVALNALAAEAIHLLAQRGLTVTVLHQTGEKDLEPTRARYAAAGITADVRAFINDMATSYARADLILSRAGATTVAELGVVGKPAILVPYPFAADNHQEINARELVRAGAALMFRQAELTPEKLADAIETLVTDPAALARMGSAMKALGRPDAAATIVDWGAAQVEARHRAA